MTKRVAASTILKPFLYKILGTDLKERWGGKGNARPFNVPYISDAVNCNMG
jgi:hypothetical protein